MNIIIRLINNKGDKMSNIHIVKKGDTLWGISNKYHIKLN
ncbi:LysM peptidoglycan-binding domain-containing protein, partial [Acinetobacter seifertii]|nr:LysM peptidoglycan-binding domain-containing protein [Acinetobacter seifertii]